MIIRHFVDIKFPINYIICEQVGILLSKWIGSVTALYDHPTTERFDWVDHY